MKQPSWKAIRADMLRQGWSIQRAGSRYTCTPPDSNQKVVLKAPHKRSPLQIKDLLNQLGMYGFVMGAEPPVKDVAPAPSSRLGGPLSVSIGQMMESKVKSQGWELASPADNGDGSSDDELLDKMSESVEDSGEKEKETEMKERTSSENRTLADWGSALRKELESMEMSNTELGEVLGLSGQAVGRWVRGQSVPSQCSYLRVIEAIPNMKKIKAPPNMPGYESPPGFPKGSRPEPQSSTCQFSRLRTEAYENGNMLEQILIRPVDGGTWEVSIKRIHDSSLENANNSLFKQEVTSPMLAISHMANRLEQENKSKAKEEMEKLEKELLDLKERMKELKRRVG